MAQTSPLGLLGAMGGVQAVSRTEQRTHPGVGGAGPGVLRAGVELGPRCSFSRPLAQQKCDSTTSDREITPVSCCSQQAFGARSRPHLHDAGRVTRSWGGGPTPRGIGPRVLHRSQRPHDLPFSRMATVHRQPAGQGPLQKKQLSFQRGSPGGVGGPGSPGLSRRSSAVLPAPPSQAPRR